MTEYSLTFESESEVTDFLHDYFVSLFPKSCKHCGHTFDSLRDWIVFTAPLGHVISYDADEQDWRPAAMKGSLVYANCACGDTLTLSTDSLPISTRYGLLEWLQQQTQRQQCEPHDILDRIRAEIRRRELAPADSGHARN